MIDLSEDYPNDDNFYDSIDLHGLSLLQGSLFLERRLFCTIQECANIWQNYSSELAASWLDMPQKENKAMEVIESCRGFKSYSEWSK